jgi:hypothetical protein
MPPTNPKQDVLTIRREGARAFVVNRADDRDHAHLNSVADAPEALRDIRRDTIETLLRVARKPGEQVVKVVAKREKLPATVSGYVTFLRFLQGSTCSDLEKKLGFNSGALSSGAHIFNVDALALNADNVVPRGNSDWSAGVTPRDLDNLSKKEGVTVEYDPSYPPASDPVIQFKILTAVPFVGAPRFIKAGETV